MEYSPPPLFKQGASARAKMMFFALIAVALLMADARLGALGAARQVVGVVLYPLQVLAMLPRDGFFAVTDYFSSLNTLHSENRLLHEKQILNAQQLQQNRQLQAENAQLRKLLAASETIAPRSVLSEILYDARDPFSRKLIVNRGQRQGIERGQPVIDDLGVVGQVTRVFPMTAEVTLLTDKDHAIPVQVLRSGVRSVAYGRGQAGVLELRFMASNADIQKGDVLLTSGIDGVYPAGLAVATVVSIDSKTSDAFARILCLPTAGVSRNRQLLVLLPDARALPEPRPEEEVLPDTRPRRSARQEQQESP